MARPQPIVTKPGRKSGEFIVVLPPGWELRLRRVLKELLKDTLPDPRERGLTHSERLAAHPRTPAAHRGGDVQFITDLVWADIVGKEVALSTRNRYGTS